MIYTLGNEEAYDRRLREREALGNPLLKMGRRSSPDGSILFVGGSVWQTEAEAQIYLEEKQEQGESMLLSVWGVDADWEADTASDPDSVDATWRCLTRDAPIIRLDSSTPHAGQVYDRKGRPRDA